MHESLRRFASLLSSDAWREMRWLCVLAAFAGLLETGGVASVLPFLAVLAQPELAASDPRIVTLTGALGAGDASVALALLGGIALAALVITNAFSALTTLRLVRFANRHGDALAVRLLALYLRQPYAFILHRHTAELQKNVLNEAYRVTVGLLTPVVHMVAKSFVVLFLLILLFVVDAALASIVGVVLGALYFAVFRAVRSLLNAAGRESVQAGTLRARHAQEALAGFKEIKLHAREREFVARFAQSSLRWADAQAKAQALSALPRYAVEIIAFGFVFAVAISLLATEGAAAKILPVLGLYAFAGYRLMPALEHVFAGWAALRYGSATLDELMRDLALEPAGAPPGGAPLDFRSDVSLDEVGFRHAGGADWAVRGISLRVERGSSVALVGPTGCGKTTVVDLLMGLLVPQEGAVRVDGAALADRSLESWQRRIGHVPQNIFLCDASIAHNIAFGLDEARIDMARVEKAARLASLHGFVSELPQRYATIVGERGIRISGGERQRIGIARALYDDPELLVLDEATSALDNATERAVLEALQSLAGKVTTVLVAHRLSTVRHCDLICVMDGGRIVERGRYEALKTSGAHFQALAAR